MSKIFVSYRRDDSDGTSGRIRDRLVREFGERDVFLDVHSISSGSNWNDTIRNALLIANVVLVIIGQRWMNSVDASGTIRLFEKDDYVRLEIRTALETGCRIIPVLLNGISMPSRALLPEDIQGLAMLQAASVHHATFERDIAELTATITSHLALGRRGTVENPEHYILDRDEVRAFVRASGVTLWLISRGAGLSLAVLQRGLNGEALPRLIAERTFVSMVDLGYGGKFARLFRVASG